MPGVRMIGVRAAGSPARRRSLRERQIVTAPARTTAEGISVETPCVAAVANLTALAGDYPRVCPGRAAVCLLDQSSLEPPRLD